MKCDDYQIAFEQQRAGAAASITPAELNAHVAACAACAAYLEVSRKVSDSMTTTLTMSPLPLDLDSIRARIARRRRQLGRNRVIGPVTFFAGMMVFSLAGSSSLAQAIGASLLGAVALAAAIVFLGRRRMAELLALERKGGGDLTLGFRTQLTREIKELTSSLWIFPFLAMLLTYEELLAGRMPTTVHLVLAASLLALIPHTLIRRRRLVRERALLDRSN